MYDVRNRTVVDPLNGVGSMNKGIITPVYYEDPMNNNYYNIFSFCKIAAKLSLKLDESIVKFIMNNNTELKVNPINLQFF